MANELQDAITPEEHEQMAAFSAYLVALMHDATAQGMSNAAVILAVLGATTSAIEQAEGRQVEEVLESGITIKAHLEGVYQEPNSNVTRSVH